MTPVLCNEDIRKKLSQFPRVSNFLPMNLFEMKYGRKAKKEKCHTLRTMPNSNQNNMETEYPTHIRVTTLFSGYLLTEHDTMAARWINLLNN